MEIRETQLKQNNSIELTPPSLLKEEEINSIYEEETCPEQKSDIEELNALLGEDKSKTIIDKAIELIKTLLGIAKDQTETKDGVIDFTKQAKNGDCWLLTGVNSLTYSEKGREIIKDALEYQEDSTIVHLKGVGDYTVTNEELEEAKQKDCYATGDDDMVILELAIGKVLQEFKDKNMDFESYKDSKNMKFEDELITSNGFSENAIYFLTGKVSQKIKDKEEMTDALNELSNNHSNMALTTSIKDRDTNNITAQTISGNDISLSSRHAYAIKSISEDSVLVVNPWDASETIEFSKETFVETFDDIIACDLSGNNPQASCMIYPQINEDGSKTFFYDSSDSRFKGSDGEVVVFDNISRTYSSDNILLEETFFKNGEKFQTQTYDKNGNTLDIIEY